MRIQNIPAITPIRSTADKMTFAHGELKDVKRPEGIDLNNMAPRDLPTDAIQHHTAKLVFSPEIDGALEEVLENQPEEVKEAAYRLFERNFFPVDAGLSEDDRAALREAGLSQAQFLADRFMNEEDGNKFMDSVRMIAALSQTGKMDAETGAFTYAELPQKPIGAPDDYVNVGELMKKYDPEGHRKMLAAMQSGENGVSLMIQFTKKLRHNPEWVEDFKKERQTFMNELENAELANRFEEARTSSLDHFVQDMSRLIEAGINNGSQALLNRNVGDFAALLQGLTHE